MEPEPVAPWLLKCPRACDIPDLVDLGPCTACDGTGLQFPDLSVACPCGCHGWTGQGDNGPIHPNCLEGRCSGRVRLPDMEYAEALAEAGKPLPKFRGIFSDKIEVVERQAMTPYLLLPVTDRIRILEQALTEAIGG